MDELRWLLIILGALVIGAIYLHGTIQNWRHDGPPWSRRRRSQREPFADHSLREPHVDDEFDELGPVTVRRTDDTGEPSADDRPPLESDGDTPGRVEDEWAADTDQAEPDDGFPAWARSRAGGERSPAEEWPVPDLEPEQRMQPSNAGGESSESTGQPARSSTPETGQGDDATSPAEEEERRWSAGKVSRRLRQALKVSGEPGRSAPDETDVDDGAAIPPGMEEKIVVINVMAPEGELFVGASVLDALYDAGLEHGEHAIFHHHIEGARGRISEFSVANILNPGWFDPDRMDEVETPGLAFFLRLPGPFDPAAAFEAMLSAARRVARRLQGHMLDARRCDLTQQSIEHLREEMVEYRRRMQLANRQRRT